MTLLARDHQHNADTFLQKRPFAAIAGVLSGSPSGEAREAALELAMALLAMSSKPATKSSAGKKLIGSVYAILASEVEQIGGRSAAADLLNMLLAGCKPNGTVLAQHTTLQQLAGILERCSDNMLQSVVFEVLYRFAKQTAAHEQLAAAFSPYDPACLALLASPLQGQDFAQLTRTFLNAFNASLGERQRIFSVQCRDTEQWADFGVAEMSYLPAAGDEERTLVAYRDVRHVRVADSSVLLVLHSDAVVALQLDDGGCETVRRRVAEQIRAVALNAERAVKSSVLTMHVPAYAPPVPSLEEICSSPQQQTSTAAPTPTPLPHHAPAALVPLTPQPLPFATPGSVYRKAMAAAAAAAAAPSPASQQHLPPPPSPLVASIMQFGAELEGQLEREKQLVRLQSEQYVAHVRESLEKLCQTQQRQAAEARKRSDPSEELRQETGRLKRCCTDALAQVHAALAAATTLDERVARLLQGREQEQTLALSHQRERDDFFAQFRIEE